MIVGCKLPHGLRIEHNNQTIVLNGTNVGYDPEAPFRNGAAPDAADRAYGAGLTTLSGDQAAAFKDWYDLTKSSDGPAKSGAIFFSEKEADTREEAKLMEGEDTGLGGLDPDKDLPKDVTTDADAPVKGKAKA